MYTGSEVSSVLIDVYIVSLFNGSKITFPFYTESLIIHELFLILHHESEVVVLLLMLHTFKLVLISYVI